MKKGKLLFVHTILFYWPATLTTVFGAAGDRGMYAAAAHGHVRRSRGHGRVRRGGGHGHDRRGRGHRRVRQGGERVKKGDLFFVHMIFFIGLLH